MKPQCFVTFLCSVVFFSLYSRVSEMSCASTAPAECEFGTAEAIVHMATVQATNVD